MADFHRSYSHEEELRIKPIMSPRSIEHLKKLRDAERKAKARLKPKADRK